ncbi:MAG: aminotransferase class I/II-fold pyridoxal phosphate-dependent enzyme [archaeon]
MAAINMQAEELNSIIEKANPIIYDLLSEKGKAIYFPKEGILAQSAQAKGKKINATIGAAIEDDGTPMRLSTISKYIGIDPKDAFSYAGSYGKPELRTAWKNLIYKKNPSLKANVSEPVVTCALTHGLSMIGYLFVNQGDKIILADKLWGNYRLIFENAYGASLDTFNTFVEKHFDTEALNNKLNENFGKKIVLLNFPNNPTGYTPTNSEVKEIAEIIKKAAVKGNKIIVICDDAYFGLVFEDGIYSESIFTLLANIHENVLAVKLDGATKEDYAWGLRVGFITYASKGLNAESYKALEDKTAGAVRGSISNAPHLSQSLVLKSINSLEYISEKKKKFDILKGRYEKIKETLRDKKYEKHFSPVPFNSGYFMCIKLQEGLDSEKIRHILLSKYDTGVISIKNMLRIAFSSVAQKDMKQLFDNIYNACEDFFKK